MPKKKWEMYIFIKKNPPVMTKKEKRLICGVW